MAASSKKLERSTNDSLSTVSTAEIQRILIDLSASLQSRSEDVLAAWRQRAEDDPELQVSLQWPRRQLEDHLPELVTAFCTQLRAWPAQSVEQTQYERKTAESHSQHRWQQGYDVRSLTREWGHFNASLVDGVDCFEAEMNLEDADVAAQLATRAAMRQARSALASMILESTTQSTAEYVRLQQSQAAMRARELENAVAHLLEMERSRGSLLRQATHDLRGSLGIVTGSASIIERGELSPEDEAEVHRILGRGVASLHQMMTDLMDLSRLEAGQEQLDIAPFDAAKVLCDLCETSRPLAEARGLSLDCAGPDSLPVHGDRVKVRRIAQNLILNALKYTRHGSVTVEWAEHNADLWLLRVRDTGPGFSSTTEIAQELQSATETAREVEGQTEGESNPHLSDERNQPMPLLQSPTSAADLEPGEGIGLSIVKRLCELLGAGLELDSELGQGSTFRVLFPRHPQS